MAVRAAPASFIAMKWPQKYRLSRRPPLGMALPTVLALSMVSSVLLLAGWRQITLAQGWSRHHAAQWDMRQMALTQLLATADAVLHPPPDTDFLDKTPWRIPLTLDEWKSALTALPGSGCANGLCQSLLAQGNQRTDWLQRTAGAHAVALTNGLQCFHWVELLPHPLPPTDTSPAFTYRITVVVTDPERQTQAGWQAVWQPTAASAPEKPVRLADLQRVLELLP